MSWWSKLFKKRSADPPFELHYRTVIVYVHDGKTSGPLEGVRISTRSTATSTRSDGRAELLSADPVFDLTASIDGYKPQTKTVDLDAGAVVTFHLAPAKPEVPDVLKGQLVIAYQNAPMGPAPGQPHNIVFIDQTDVIGQHHGWPKAFEIIDHYVALGANAKAEGPIVAAGYDGEYPPTDWRGQADEYAAYLEEVTNRIAVVFLFFCPDIRPYWNGYEYNIPLLRAEIVPVLMHPTIQRLIKEGRIKGVTQWEQYTYIDEMVPLYDLMTEVFGPCNWGWHNPVWPAHLSPGMGNEDEKLCWVVARDHGIGFMLLQGDPVQLPASFRPLDPLTHEPRAPIEQLMYDAADMRGRFERGEHWNLGMRLDGKPITLYIFESEAYHSYHLKQNATEAGALVRAAATAAGFADCLDGLAKR